jgi:hypothetical protein
MYTALNGPLTLLSRTPPSQPSKDLHIPPRVDVMPQHHVRTDPKPQAAAVAPQEVVGKCDAPRWRGLGELDDAFMWRGDSGAI